MRWKKKKEKDDEGTFTVKFGGYMAERSDGIKFDYGFDGLVIYLPGGEQWSCTWEEILSDFLRERKEAEELALAQRVHYETLSEETIEELSE